MGKVHTEVVDYAEWVLHNFGRQHRIVAIGRAGRPVYVAMRFLAKKHGVEPKNIRLIDASRDFPKGVSLQNASRMLRTMKALDDRIAFVDITHSTGKMQEYLTDAVRKAKSNTESLFLYYLDNPLHTRHPLATNKLRDNTIIYPIGNEWPEISDKEKTAHEIESPGHNIDRVVSVVKKGGRVFPRYKRKEQNEKTKAGYRDLMQEVLREARRRA